MTPQLVVMCLCWEKEEVFIYTREPSVMGKDARCQRSVVCSAALAS